MDRFDSIFFVVSKLFWFIFSPDTFLVLLLVLCLVLFWCRAGKTALVLLHAVTIILVVCTFFPVGEWVLYPLEKNYPPNIQLPDKVDGIVMLAGPEDLLLSSYFQQPQLTSAAERYTAFVHLINTYPDAKHVFSGGIGSLDQSGMKSSDFARQLLKSLGLDTKSIIFESRSRNTYENAVLTKKIIAPEKDETWLLVTSASHMPRSVGIFTKLNWNIVPYPVDFRAHPEQGFRVYPKLAENLKELRQGMHEWLGLTAYYLTGKTSSLFPNTP